MSGTFGTVGDYTLSFEQDFPFGPTLRTNAHNDRHVVTNPCGGISRAQGWVLRFDELVQGWRVRGDLSGEQDTIAYEDIRYVSDDGEISFLILSGGTPDEAGLVWKYWGMMISWWVGILLLWLAAILTLVTGWDYFSKALPFLRDAPAPEPGRSRAP